MTCKIKEKEEKKGAVWEKEEIFKKVRREGREEAGKRRGGKEEGASKGEG